MTDETKISASDDELKKMVFRFSITKSDPLGPMSAIVDKTPDGGIDLFVSAGPQKSGHIYLTADETRRLIVWLCGYESS